MATTRTETSSAKKTAAKAAAAAAQAQKPESRQAAPQTPGEIIAERYRSSGYEAIVGKNGENVSAAMSAGEAMLAGFAEVSQEMVDFANARLRQDLEIAEEFSKARTPEEIFECQCSFAERAAKQYAEETSKLFAMMARIQQATWAPVQERTREALQNLNGENDKTED